MPAVPATATETEAETETAPMAMHARGFFKDEVRYTANASMSFMIKRFYFLDTSRSLLLSGHDSAEAAGHVVEQFIHRKPMRNDLPIERPVDYQLNALAVLLGVQ